MKRIKAPKVKTQLKSGAVTIKSVPKIIGSVSIRALYMGPPIS